MCVCVCTSTAAREHSSICVPACEDIFACENSLREHFPDQLYTLGLGSGCPWKNLGKVLWNSVFYAVCLMPRVIYWLQRQTVSRSWTVTRWTKSMTSPVLRWTWPPRLQSVMIQTVLRLGFSQTRSGGVLWIRILREEISNKLLIMDWYQLINDNVLMIMC